jgi:prepilin-type N-terminal cleavage/methylation domain-containing protein
LPARKTGFTLSEVLITLAIIGIVAAGVLGFTIGDFTILTFSKAIYQGFTSMTDIFLLSMLTGGLTSTITKK